MRYRINREISVEGRGVPYPVTTFLEANFPGIYSNSMYSITVYFSYMIDYIMGILLKQGFVEPTPIQAQVSNLFCIM